MISNLKTVILLFLIVGSLYQSYQISFSNPKPDHFEIGEYIPTELIGNQVDVKDVLFPSRIFIHFGEDTHTVLYPSTTNFAAIQNVVNSKSFQGIYLNKSIDVDIDFQQLNKTNKGIELVFDHGIPFNILRNTMNIQTNSSISNEIIDRINIVYIEKQDVVKVYFIAKLAGIVFEAIDNDIAKNDMLKLLAKGNPAESYEYIRDKILVPTNPIENFIYSIGTKEYSIEQLKQTFFVDPAVTRNIKERDGSEIYTDGNRGLQIISSGKRFNFTNPIASNLNTESIKEQLVTSIKFINDHGGWDGDYQFIFKRTDQSVTKEKFNFQMFYQTYPLIDTSKQKIGMIDGMAQNSVMTNYERSLVILKDVILEKTPYSLSGKENIIEKFDKHPKSTYIEDVYPVYTTNQTKDVIKLYPVWMIKLKDGSVEILK
jgi:regulatory protein YycH of two-component signal transduction system YycFG